MYIATWVSSEDKLYSNHSRTQLWRRGLSVQAEGRLEEATALGRVAPDENGSVELVVWREFWLGVLVMMFDVPSFSEARSSLRALGFRWNVAEPQTRLCPLTWWHLLLALLWRGRKVLSVRLLATECVQFSSSPPVPCLSHFCCWT